MDEYSFKIKNYKCFIDEAGFDQVNRVNIIIGRNNTGKSSLLDMVKAVCTDNFEFDSQSKRGNENPQVVFRGKVTTGAVKATFPSNTSGGAIGGNHGEYGKQFVGREIKWTRSGSGNTSRGSLISCEDSGIKPTLAKSSYDERLAGNLSTPIKNKIFRRIAAERDVVQESGGHSQKISIESNGNGITNAIQSFINHSNLPSELVEQNILEDLNEIFSNDANFTDIVCQLHESGFWEIYLEEEYKGRVALSKSGSGLKTVIMVLVYIYLLPTIDKKPLSSYVYAFEELENNMHPALLRRLNEYIYEKSTDHDFCYFITTHSNVLIDQFSKQEDAQIVHVTQKEGVSSTRTVRTYIENNGVLDDLDVRASDLLQANGVIWVEGPSDRIYINRWIDLWSEGELREGTHYQVIFYGGRLLSHLSAEEPDLIEGGVSLLRTNRNAMILIDSDRRSKNSRINKTKSRIRSEFEAMKSLCWITKGREIENYVSGEVVGEFLGVSPLRNPKQFEDFFGYLDRREKGIGSKYRAKKPLLAEMLISHMTKKNSCEMFDLDVMVTKICSEILRWNE